LFRLRTSLPAQAVSNPVTDVAGFFYGCRPYCQIRPPPSKL